MGDRNRSYLLIVAAFIVGLLIGWFVLGWLLAPVQWTNSYMQDLRPEDQQTFLAAQAEAFELTRDNAQAVARLTSLGDQKHVAEVAAQAIQQAEAKGDVLTADRVRNLSAALGLDLAGVPSAAVEPAVAPAAQGGSGLVTILGLALLAGGIILAAWLLLRGRPSGSRERDEFAPEVLVEDSRPRSLAGMPSAAMATAAVAERASSGQDFVAEFQQGEVAYDQSFDIEGPDGAYWGECGMTMSEAVQGDPERVTALEVWLFDKSDIRTVTKVLMSDYAYGNQALREKLSSRGDAVLLAPDLGFVLDAQTLRLMGKIVDLEYDDRVGPARSTIRRLQVQLRVMRQAA